MASLYPDIDTIKRLHQPATVGELVLLHFLDKHLSSEFEVYFQPFINGDRPDIVILKKNIGAIIIEVKDWNLDCYKLDDNTDWHLRKNDSYVKSPLSQVKCYKDNIINIHVENFLPKTIMNTKNYGIVNTMVYFHNAYSSTINSFLLDDYQGKEHASYRKSVSYVECWGIDSLTEKNLNNYFSKIGFWGCSKLFTDSLYLSFKRYLQPPYHLIEEGKDIKYTANQKELIRSEIRPRRKIKGLAGSGKTFVLAKRAVNAYLRTESTILILTYNLSLRNYIHDRISDVREEFPWKNFFITNYHQFFKSEANNYGLEIKSLSPFSDTDFFESVKDNIQKYKVILIDEVQDYASNWLDIITKYFLDEDGEFVVFGDEKQNIYKRELDDNNEAIIKSIPGKWNKSLNVSKRFTNDIGTLAMKYQKEFLSKKYSIDELNVLQNPKLDFDQKVIKYYNFGTENSNEDIFFKYCEIVREYNIHPSDIGILSAKVDFLRELDYLIRHKCREKTITTFETKEFYDHLEDKCSTKEALKKELEEIRRNKKYHFWMKTGTTKLSSIHSFKGWEVNTLFLILEPDENNQFESLELIYTGLTRAQINLFVINLGNSFYDSFFMENI